MFLGIVVHIGEKMRANIRFVVIGKVVAEKCTSNFSTRFTMVKTSVLTMVKGDVVFSRQPLHQSQQTPYWHASTRQCEQDRLRTFSPILNRGRAFTS